MTSINEPVTLIAKNALASVSVQPEVVSTETLELVEDTTTGEIPVSTTEYFIQKKSGPPMPTVAHNGFGVVDMRWAPNTWWPTVGIYLTLVLAFIAGGGVSAAVLVHL